MMELILSDNGINSQSEDKDVGGKYIWTRS